MIYMLLGRQGTDAGFMGILSNIMIALIAVPFLKIIVDSYTANFDNWFTSSSWSSRHKSRGRLRPDP